MWRGDTLPRRGSNGTSSSATYWYLFKSLPALTGNDLLESGSSATVDRNTGQPIVTLQFTPHGATEFQRSTKAEYNRGRVKDTALILETGSLPYTIFQVAPAGCAR